MFSVNIVGLLLEIILFYVVVVLTYLYIAFIIGVV